MAKKIEKLADQLIMLTPDESHQLQLIIKAKMMPKIAKEQSDGLLAQAKNPQMAAMGQRQGGQMPMPNSRDAAMRGLLRG